MKKKKLLRENVSKVICILIAIVYVLVLARLVVFKNGFGGNYRGINLIPFQYMQDARRYGTDISVFLKNVLGNVGIFIPFGMLLPAAAQKLDWKRVILTGVIVSVTIEVLQYVFVMGVADIDDVILNTVGVAIGTIVYFGIAKKLDMKWENLFGTIFTVGGIGVICAFLLYYFGYGGSLTGTPCYTQNEEVVEDLDLDNWDYEILVSNASSLTEGMLEGINYNYDETTEERLEEAITIQISEGTEYYSSTISSKYSPNGNVRSTTNVYDVITAQEFEKEILQEEEGCWVSIWSKDGKTADAIMISIRE